MSAQIQLLADADGFVILVPGDDPAEIHRQALKFAAEEDVTVDTPAAEVMVRTVRALPWCGPLCNGCRPKIAPKTPSSSTPQRPTTIRTSARICFARCGLRRAAPASATAGAGTAQRSRPVTSQPDGVFASRSRTE